MNNQVNFNDDDINIFINSYEQHVLENPLLNSKIPIWVEFLKTKKYYRENGIDEDYYFNKRFGITNNDLQIIIKLINRVKMGKSLERKVKTNVKGDMGVTSTTIYSNFDEQEDYENKKPSFELLGEVQDAMDKYYHKMKKNAERKNWKQNQNDRTWNPSSRNYYKDSDVLYEDDKWPPINSVSNIPDRYYSEDILSERPSIEYDVQEFAKSKILNMNKTNIIQKFDKINNTLQDNQLLSNTYGNNPNNIGQINCNKKVQFNNQIDDSIHNKDIGVMRFEQDQNAMSRLWQQQDILRQRDLTRNTAIPNKNPFEHQFDYLDCNYNRVEDPRLIGQSSRLENRSTFNR